MGLLIEQPPVEIHKTTNCDEPQQTTTNYGDTLALSWRYNPIAQLLVVHEMAAIPPFTPPAATHAVGTTPRAVRFRHPAYPSSAPNLLVLMAADGDGGLDFDVALTACCIVADADWDDGYLAQASAGNNLQRIDRPQDGLLDGLEYFFCVKERDPLFRYPVIPSFHHWRFPHGSFDENGTPHGNLPPPWKNLRLPEFAPPRPTLKGPAAAMDRDITCRVSGYMDGVEKAHLVPEGERLWFVSNRMDRYCRRPLEVSAINDDKNILVLRKDLHHLFDARRFTFVPKRFGACASEHAQVVTHVLLPSGSPEFVGLYHNRSPQLICGISVECLFARFAWSIFTDEHIPFFQSDLEYTVRLWDKAKGEAEIQTLRGLDVRSSAQVFEATRSHSRSVSPKKRSLPAQGGGGVEDGDGDWPDDGDGTNVKHDHDGWDEPPRGRSRKRRWEAVGRDGEVPGLSPFASTTQSSLASGRGRQISQPQTPKEGNNTAASQASASDTSRSQKAPKRIHVEEPDVESPRRPIPWLFSLTATYSVVFRHLLAFACCLEPRVTLLDATAPALQRDTLVNYGPCGRLLLRLNLLGLSVHQCHVALAYGYVMEQRGVPPLGGWFGLGQWELGWRQMKARRRRGRHVGVKGGLSAMPSRPDDLNKWMPIL
ncbi:hypothetical protein B0T24DRAFT_635758 [Lasiosphaeria ovina]|uniref:HNH nuclease domain-containing protein n=1 Tax=Lasiosphaeria ovina TaxID=92902 RepID=A0AAE0K113_9PEZI|nr:hypothetical protein B0T24DRAFT_635758 [Lasiosphaeria ovina]